MAKKREKLEKRVGGLENDLMDVIQVILMVLMRDDEFTKSQRAMLERVRDHGRGYQLWRARSGSIPQSVAREFVSLSLRAIQRAQNERDERDD